MDELIEDYQRKINTINELLKYSSNSEETISRLKIKAGCYRSFLTDLKRASDTNDVLHFVIERLKSLRSFDVQEAGYYGEGVEEVDYANLTGDYISIKKIIEELKNAL